MVRNSQVLKKCGAYVDFKKEMLRLNVSDPELYLVENDVTLIMELWDQGAWQDEILGRGELTMLMFMDSAGESSP
jgi:hypothetical protein